MSFFRRFSMPCLSLGALLALAAPAFADNDVHVQPITWVKPTNTVTTATPTQKAPTLISQPVRREGNQPQHPSKLKQASQAVAPAEPQQEPAAVTPLFPDKPTLSKLVASYYGIGKNDVEKAFSYYGYTDDALVALFMANASNARVDRIIALRLGNSWRNVIGFLQLNTKYLFRNLQIGNIPQENARNCMSYLQFNSWREAPEFRDLGDLSVRELVGASLLDNRYHIGPLEALRQVHESGGVINALSHYTTIE